MGVFGLKPTREELQEAINSIEEMFGNEREIKQVSGGKAGNFVHRQKFVRSTGSSFIGSSDGSYDLGSEGTPSSPVLVPPST